MNSTTSPVNRDIRAIDSALCRATIYSALALAFRPPTSETVVRMIEPENCAALATAAALIDVGADPALAAVFNDLAAAGRAELLTLASSYVALFGHTARGMIAPYETEYGNEPLFQQPQELGDLMGFYRAFGLSLRLDRRERADHISCECEFMCFLAMKEAYALEHNDATMLETTLKAQKAFLRDHLGRFLPAFASQLGREHAAMFYHKLADLCLRFIAQEATRMGIRLGATNLSLRPADDDRVPMACGSAAECAAMPGACAPEDTDSV